MLELFQWTKDNEINKNKVTNLKDELADVYYWLLLLADHYDIDIDDALEEKIKKNEKISHRQIKGKLGKVFRI